MGYTAPEPAEISHVDAAEPVTPTSEVAGYAGYTDPAGDTAAPVVRGAVAVAAMRGDASDTALTLPDAPARGWTRSPA